MNQPVESNVAHQAKMKNAEGFAGEQIPRGEPGEVIDRSGRVCVIGAGPAGLTTARALARNGVLYDQFERHSDVGGVWDMDSEYANMYESAHLISSKASTQVADFPLPEEAADYPSHRVIKRYFRDFAEAFGLYVR